MKHKSKKKSVLSALLSAVMLLGSFTVVTFAAQSNEYVDPADHWLSSNGRTNELDMNATEYSRIMSQMSRWKILKKRYGITLFPKKILINTQDGLGMTSQRYMDLKFRNLKNLL